MESAMKTKTKFYFAPMEGVAGYIYRNVYHEHFHHIDQYFAPFISTSPNGISKMKEFRDILPENNKDMCLIPQLLSNNADDFILAAKQIKDIGYHEINLNVGCPSGTVTSKGKGSGMLLDIEKLDHFLYNVFENCHRNNIRLSVKTRIGFYSPDEFEKIIEIYNRYQMSELIIHPRTREDYYKNDVHLDVFKTAVQKSKNPICYNGDIFEINDYKKITEEFDGIESVMIGRGILKNPSLIENIIDDVPKPDLQKIFDFHDQIYDEYKKYMSGEKNLLFKMKEIWLYMVHSMENSDKKAKKIKKAKNIYEYESVVNEFKREA